MSFLKQKIEEYLITNNLSIAKGAKKFKLAQNVLNRLLKDGNPSLDNLIKIADGLNCSLDDLVERDFNIIIKNTNLNLNKTPYKQELLRSICTYVFFLLETNQIKLPKDITLEKIVGAIEVTYKISIKNNDVVANPKTVEAVLSKIFASTKK